MKRLTIYSLESKDLLINNKANDDNFLRSTIIGHFANKGGVK